MMFDLKKYHGNVAIISDDNKVTYDEISYLSNIISHMINVKSICLIISSNTIGCVIGYISFINNNIVPIIVDYKTTKKYLQTIIDNYNPDYIWMPNNIAQKFNINILFSSYNYSLIKFKCDIKNNINVKLALLLSTSGTIASNKFVRISYDNIKFNIKSHCTHFRLTSDDRLITTLPIHHIYGLMLLNSHLYIGSTILLTNKSIIDKNFWNFFL